MISPVYGVTLISQTPWTTAQMAAVQSACREALQAWNPVKVLSDEEVTSYWQRHLEKPYSAVVHSQRCAYTAYWHFGDDDRGASLLSNVLEKYCAPLGMEVTFHSCFW